MNKARLEKFVLYLQKENWQIFGPTSVAKENVSEEEISPFIAAHQPSEKKEKDFILIQQIGRPADLALDDRLPFFSFKRFFVPESETLFEYAETKLKSPSYFPPLAKGGEGGLKKNFRVALLGMNTLDLKVVNLYDQVFARDPYYQARRRNLLIVGYSVVPEQDNIFEYKFEENVLEHLPFDIFLAAKDGGHKLKTKNYKLFSGSIKGQRILEHFGYQDYQHIQFSGPVPEGELEPRLVLLRDKLKNKHNQKIWDELGKICIECGKCTIVCPTCFCFRLTDEPKLEKNSGTRDRCWDSCYYQEFSEVSGPDIPGRGKPKFLNSTAQRIHFWYFHKFARIPDEFDFMGCVGCRRCARVCPVGIDIAKVLKDIEES